MHTNLDLLWHSVQQNCRLIMLGHVQSLAGCGVILRPDTSGGNAVSSSSGGLERREVICSLLILRHESETPRMGGVPCRSESLCGASRPLTCTISDLAELSSHPSSLHLKLSNYVPQLMVHKH
jgi:hypothetical protein